MMPGRGVPGVIPAPLLAPGRRDDRLAVDARRGPGMVGLLRRADLAADPVVTLWDSLSAAQPDRRPKLRQSAVPVRAANPPDVMNASGVLCSARDFYFLENLLTPAS
jgi:hypothetical protein